MLLLKIQLLLTYIMTASSLAIIPSPHPAKAVYYGRTFYEHVVGSSPGSGCMFPWQQGTARQLGSIMNTETPALASWHAQDDETSNSAEGFLNAFDIIFTIAFFALDWKVRWEGYLYFSHARCIWLCVVLPFCVYSCLMQAHAEQCEWDGCVCVCVHGKSTCLHLHSMLLSNKSKPQAPIEM